MLIEFFTWLASQSISSAHKAGLTSEVAGIAGRYARNEIAWEPHLKQTSAFIEQKLALADPKKPILVLGSGLCLDLPLKALNAHPSGAVLVDAVLPFKARFKCRKLKNISFQCADITGFLKEFWAGDKTTQITPPDIAPMPNGNFGMVISCNLLSQLPLSFTNSPPSGETEQRLTAAIQLAHMRALNTIRCPLIIITDYERLETEHGKTTNIPTVAPHLLPGEPQQAWKWHIAPNGEVRTGLDIKLNVGAWLLSDY